MDVSDILSALKLASIIILNIIIVIIILKILEYLLRVLKIDLYKPFTKLIYLIKKLIEKIKSCFKKPAL